MKDSGARLPELPLCPPAYLDGVYLRNNAAPPQANACSSLNMTQDPIRRYLTPLVGSSSRFLAEQVPQEKRRFLTSRETLFLAELKKQRLWLNSPIARAV